jgi:transposase-like protein
MSIQTEQDGLTVRKVARRRAIELYRTTRFSVGAIAHDAGVSRMTLYRWLREEGIPLGRDANNEASRAREDPARISPELLGTHSYTPPPGANRIADVIDELRRQQILLVGQVAQLGGLIEALVAPAPEGA